MAIKEALIERLQTSGLSQNAVAKSMGVSASALSQYLKDKYPGDIGALERKIAQYLEISLQRDIYPAAQLGFVETSVAKHVFETAENCHIGRRIGIITGESGVGKTTAVKEYAARHSDVIIIYGRPSITTKSIIREIATKVGCEPNGSIDDVFMRIVSKLANSGRMLIVDEAEHLTARVLDQLRRLNDSEFAGIGILLVGLPRLLHILRSSAGDHKYLYSRVGWSVPVHGLTDEDCATFVHTALPGSNGLWHTFAECSSHNARALRNLIERSIEVASFNGIDISSELVRETAKLLIN